MTSAGPWSVKGIDPKAREIAKDLARRSGQTLGEWLNQMIIEGEPEPASRESALARDPGRDREPEREPPREPVRDVWAEPAPRPAAAVQALADVARPRAEREPRREPAADPAELQRVTRALTDLSTRIEAAEQRSTLAISGIDQQVAGVLSRMEGLERGQTSVAARFDGQLDEMRGAQAKLADRLRRMDEQEGPRVEAMKALETALGKVAAQIYEGESRARAQLGEAREDLSGLARRVERLDAQAAASADADLVEQRFIDMAARLEQAEARTSAAVRALESSFAGLDRRLAEAERRPAAEMEGVERRFEKLAGDLSSQVEAVRAETAERIRAAAGGRVDQLEQALKDLTGQIAEGERRAARAIDSMGREVVKIAQNLGERMQTSEARQLAAETRIGGEVSRIADAVEKRLAHGDAAQAEALERLGGEIARIAEKLADRIASSERRAAQAAEDLGERFGRVTDKLNARHDHTSADLAERIRQSEERTAKLLAETRDRIDQRLAEAQRPVAPPVAAAPAVASPAAPLMAAAQPAPVAAEPPRAAPLDPFADPAEGEPFPSDFGAPPAVPATPAPPTAAVAPPPQIPVQAPRQPQAQSQPSTRSPFDRPLDDDVPFEAEDHAADMAGFGSGRLSDGFGRAPETLFEPPPVAAEPPRPASTRELIEAARAAARQAAEQRGKKGKGLEPAPAVAAPGFEPEVSRGLNLPWRRRRESGSTLRTVVVASGLAASIGVTATGAFLLAGHSETRETAASAEAPTAAHPAASAASGAEPLAAVALSPETPALSETKPAAASAPAPSAATEQDAKGADDADKGSAKLLYTAAARELQNGDRAAGLATLRRAANLGYAPAQFHLAKLYEDGASGAPKDLAEARRWTERAATQGDPQAMFNLGLYFANGDGGPKNDTLAVGWFKRAADLGLRDAQYNLAVMTQSGRGVAANPADAYKWYLVAAAQGDAGARSAAEALKARLAPETRASAERQAAAYRAQIAAAQVRGVATD